MNNSDSEDPKITMPSALPTRGHFMDMIHPSSDVRLAKKPNYKEFAPVVTRPVDDTKVMPDPDAKTEDESEAKTAEGSNTPPPAPIERDFESEIRNVFEPIQMNNDVKKDISFPAESKSKTDPAPEDKPKVDTVSPEENKDSIAEEPAPKTVAEKPSSAKFISPFLRGIQVDKRPLGEPKSPEPLIKTPGWATTFSQPEIEPGDNPLDLLELPTGDDDSDQSGLTSADERPEESDLAADNDNNDEPEQATTVDVPAQDLADAESQRIQGSQETPESTANLINSISAKPQATAVPYDTQAALANSISVPTSNLIHDETRHEVKSKSKVPTTEKRPIPIGIWILLVLIFLQVGALLGVLIYGWLS